MHNSTPCQPDGIETSWPELPTPLAGLRWPRCPNRPLLAVHGWLDNAASFVPLAPWLAGTDLVALDWPGHGRSGHRPAGTWSPFVDYLGDLLALADRLGWQRFDLLGHSMGGGIATLFAAAFPERVRRLVLIEAVGPLAHGPERFVGELRRALLARQQYRDRRRVYADLAEPVAARMQANQLSEPVARLLVERGTQAVPGGHAFSTDPRQLLPSPSRGTEEQMLAALQTIGCPVQLLLAEPRQSYLQGPAVARRIEALRPAELHSLPGNHHFHMEQPQLLGPLIARFLARGDEEPGS